MAARSAHLGARIATVVNQPGGARRASKSLPRTSARVIALSYLGLTRAKLRSKLHSGSSLAQIADETPGRSAAGLIDAIVAGIATHAISHGNGVGHRVAGTQAARVARIRARVSAAVQRKHHAVKPSH